MIGYSKKNRENYPRKMSSKTVTRSIWEEYGVFIPWGGGGYSGFQVEDDHRQEAKIKTPKPLGLPTKAKKSNTEFPGHKNFPKIITIKRGCQ